jgi:shikimate 5-dehydrogenase
MTPCTRWRLSAEGCQALEEFQLWTNNHPGLRGFNVTIPFKVTVLSILNHITETARERELEVQNANAGESIRQAKEGLEKSGMTFTGK